MTGDERRRQLGDNDAPVEEEIEESFDRIVEEGAQRLARSWTTVLVTGTFGGLEVGVGVMAYLAVMHETHNYLLAGLAFGIGMIALLLAKSELFTEGFPGADRRGGRQGSQRPPAVQAVGRQRW